MIYFIKGDKKGGTMKKLIIIYISIISALLFTQIYNLERDYDSFTMMDFTSTLAYSPNEEVFPIEIGGITDQSKFSLFIQQFGEYASMNEINFSISKLEMIDDVRIVNRFLWISNPELNNRFNLKGNKSIDFTSKNDENYYSTDISDDKSFDFFEILDPSLLKDNKEIYRFIPYYQLNNNNYIDFKDLTVYLITDQPKKEFQNIKDYFTKINSPFADNLEMFEQHSTWQQIHENEVHETKILIPITLIVLLLILTTYTIKQNNKIMILRLHGISTLKITSKLYLPLIISCILTFLSILGICYFVVIGRPSNVTVRLDQDLIQLLLWFMISVVFVYILILLYVKFIFNIKFLKTRPNFVIILKVNLLMKVMITIITISSFIQVVSTSVPFFNNYLTSLRMKDTIENTMVITGIMNKTDLVYNDLIDKGIYVESAYYSIFKEPDSPFPNTHTFITANKNYLDSYNIKDVNGNSIDYDELSSGDLLIPSNVYIEDGQPYCQLNSCDNISIESNRVFYDYDINGSKIINPVIIFINEYKDELRINESSLYLPINDEKDIAYYEKIISKHTNEYFLESNEPKVKTYFHQANKSLIKFGSVLFVYILLFFSFVYQSTFIYLDYAKRLIAIQYIQGVSKKERYKKIYLNNSIMYIAPLLIALLILQQPIISTIFYFLGIILLELVVTSVMIYRFENKSLALILKGEDDYE